MRSCQANRTAHAVENIRKSLAVCGFIKEEKRVYQPIQDTVHYFHKKMAPRGLRGRGDPVILNKSPEGNSEYGETVESKRNKKAKELAPIERSLIS